MRGAVITFPGSNNDDDCIHTLTQLFDGNVDSLWHKDSPDLGSYDLVWLPGGFSYGDYLRCGAMASVSPIMSSIKNYAERGGKLLGTCNGFQILCESHLLPGALVRNAKQLFMCQDVHIKVDTVQTFLTLRMVQNEILTLPIAHGEGRFHIDEAGYDQLCSKDQVVFTYCDADGQLTDTSNVNGSVHSIAGICNEARNVVGLMPHPERATEYRSKDGKKFWSSLVASIGGNTL